MCGLINNWPVKWFNEDKKKGNIVAVRHKLVLSLFFKPEKNTKKYLKQELYSRTRKKHNFYLHSQILAFLTAFEKDIPSTLGQGLNGSGLRSVRKSVSRNLPEKRTEGEGGGSQTQTCEIWKCGEKKKNICGNNTILFSAPRWLGDLIETSETEVDLGEDITLIRWATCSWSWSWSSSWFWWWSWWWWFWSWFWWWWWGEEWFTWTSIL